MKTLAFLLAALTTLLTGCPSTQFHVVRTDGTVVDFYGSKNVKIEYLKTGDIEIHGLTSDASSVIKAENEAVGKVADVAGKALPLLLVP